MNIVRTILFTLAAVVWMPFQAIADECVDVELILSQDASASINYNKFLQQTYGTVQAFQDKDVQATILSAGPCHAIAVAVVFWSGPDEEEVGIEWTRLSDVASIERFAASYLNLRNTFFARNEHWSGGTDIASGIHFAVPLFGTKYNAERRVLDIAGDGESSSGFFRSVDTERSLAVAQRVIINGLIILPTIEKTTVQFYNDHVKGGLNSFVLTADGFGRYSEALKLKLMAEIPVASR